MPNWRKVITSGSNASLSLLTVPGPAINNLTASVAINALNTYNSTALNSGTVQQFATPTASWYVQHNLEELWPMVTVWQEDPAFVYNIVIPNNITSVNSNAVLITFTEPIAGYVNVSRAGHIVSGSVPWVNLVGPANVTASLNVNGGVTGSLLGTASFAVSASNTISSSFATSASLAQTASYALNAVSSSHAATASSADNFLIRQNATASNLLVSGILTAQTIVAQTITSSVSFVTGSTQFGSLLTNTHQFTGSVSITGSLTVNGEAVITSGSYNVFSSSIASRTTKLESTASTLVTASASFAAVSESYSTASGSISTRLTTIEGKYLTTGSNIMSGSQVITGSLTVTGSINASQGVTASLFGTASWALNAISSSYALSSSYAVTASYANTASLAERAVQLDVFVKNQTGVQINKGTVVRIVGAVGDNPLIQTASYTDEGQSGNTLGITIQDIANGASGYVITNGVLVGIDTSAFTAGQLLYLGLTGSIIGTAPVAPLQAVRLGEALRIQQNVGSMFVQIDNGYELGELHNVLDNSTTASYGDLLVRSGSVWTNSKQLTGSYGLTGSLQATSFTGSLFGTASWANNAISASFATTSSYAVSSSFATSASFATTASFAISASYAATASFANSGFNIGISQIQTATVASSTAGANNLFTTSTGSFTGAKYLYTVTNGSNARTGEVLAIWNNGSVQFTDNSTLDIGSTTAVTASVAIVTAQAQLNFETNTSGWTIKSQATFI